MHNKFLRRSDLSRSEKSINQKVALHKCSIQKKPNRLSHAFLILHEKGSAKAQHQTVSTRTNMLLFFQQAILWPGIKRNCGAQGVWSDIHVKNTRTITNRAEERSPFQDQKEQYLFSALFIFVSQKNRRSIRKTFPPSSLEHFYYTQKKTF